MIITLNTPLKEINFPNEIGDFWNNTLVSEIKKLDDEYYSFFTKDEIPRWSKMISSPIRVYELFKKIDYFYKKERNKLKDKGVDLNSNLYASIKMLIN